MRLLGRRPVIVLVALVLLAGIGWALWPSDPVVRGEDHTITVVDGPADDQRVALDTTFFPPAGGGRAPLILLGHGFGGSKQSVREQAVYLARQGYAVLTWSARGFGRSTGEIALNSPDYEVKDVRQLIDWAAKRPEVLLDASGDPRMGMAGGSYGGAIALMTAAYDNRVDALVPQITWHDLADALFPNATGQGPETGVFKRMWAGLFFNRGGGTPTLGGLGGGTAAGAAPGAGAGRPEPSGTRAPARPPTEQEVRCGRFLPAICDMYQQVATTGKATATAVETLRRSSPISVPGRIRVPTLLIQGQHDSLFPLSQADANARAIAATGAPVQVTWYAGGHDGGDDEVDWLDEQITSWFDRHLKHDDAAPAGAAFTVTRDGGRDPGTRRNVLVHATAGRYSGLGGTRTQAIPLTGPEQPVASPPGGSPASISSVPGLGGLSGGGAGGLSVSVDMPGQFATFSSAPLTRPLTVTGTPTARIKVYGEGEVTLFAKLYDETAPAQATLPDGLVAPIKVTATEAGTDVTVTLPAIDHRFDVGHRVRLVITTTDLAYANPSSPAVHRVGLAEPAVTMPVAPGLTTPPTGPDVWTWALPLAALVIATALVLAGRRRRRDFHDEKPELREVPLVIDGLTKRYRNGELAVNDLSFRVEPNQVLGLLGPNGAGKTTTLRMLMGLIHPDAGEIRIFGHRVTPGAPVLSRLGSFVEGPGFLPHLSGRANLELYWQATGRPAADAHLEEALEIAGLGAALDRAVRTYSQGMRQRLAIAQAMLGLPDLLVLDEPTNGLDPPQIAEMRRVLIRYAATGRTVIVSSHLLAEVEQTCARVVVMHRGRLVAAGPVGELLGAAASNGTKGRLEDVFLDLIGERA
ncbi:alpha/beta fold hydrolase [Thermopolyspora sp. NPDC052614]|uniref:alpha/beta fold hydrolase n=1 Tax=Thermopolyspora sp. NPDC052614 TaxID=3155682 RepID=UPI00342F74AB